MNITMHFRWGVLLLLVLALGNCAGAKTSPVGKITWDVGSGISLNIGQRRSIAEGDRASLRALARLNRKYPRQYIYNVYWTVRLESGPLSRVHTLFARTEQSVRREGIEFPGTGKAVNHIGYDGITSAVLQRIVRHGGSFREIEKVCAGYSKGQEYWR